MYMDYTVNAKTKNPDTSPKQDNTNTERLAYI